MTAPPQNHRARQSHSAAAANASSYRWRVVAIFGLYIAISLIYFARGLIGHPDCFIGRDTDPPQTMWFFSWWRFALAHRLNPFVTDYVWAPLGINLAWTTFFPVLAWVSIPLQLTVGEPATYNIIVTLMPALAAFGAFLLCRRVSGGYWPSVLGGYVFGFSSYMLGQILGHLDLVAVFPAPLVALWTLKRLDREISARRFALGLAALLTVQFLCFPELFATVTLVGVFSLLLAFALFDSDVRIRLRSLVIPIVAAYLISAALLSPYLYYLLAFEHPSGAIWPSSRFCADLIGFLVPRRTIWWGFADFAAMISRRFAGTIIENGDYLGVVLIVFVEIFRRRFWPTPAGKFLTILLLAIVIAALGPTLHVAGVEGFPMPWAIFQRLPLIENILPVRFMMYAFLILGVMAAMWFAASTTRPLTKCMAAAAIVVSIAPNPHASFWITRLDIPAFFTDRTYANELEPREIILPLPWAQKGNSMYWQMESGMYFRMAGGWTGIVPFQFARMPIVNFFEGADDLPEPGEQLKTYIAHFGVKAVIVDPADSRFQTFQAVLASLSVPAAEIGGLWIYKIPREKFADYEKVDPAQAEARAIALRFDTILPAAAKYLDSGHDPARLSPLELKRLNLLPADWQVQDERYTLANWSIGIIDQRIAIALHGSYDGFKPLIDRLSMQGAEILYPAPARWDPRAIPDKILLRPLLVFFDREKFDAAVAKLKASPPPEMTTPFLGADSR